MEEVWKPVKEHFSVSSMGRVKRNNGDKILPQYLGRRDGYWFVNLGTIEDKKYKNVHRMVCEAFHESDGVRNSVDHIDGDRKNNHVGNLRWATVSENNANKEKRSGKCTSSYKGVSWNKRKEAWQVQFSFKKKRYFQGYFKREQELDAAKAYNEGVVRVAGDFFKLNDVV